MKSRNLVRLAGVDSGIDVDVMSVIYGTAVSGGVRL